MAVALGGDGRGLVALMGIKPNSAASAGIWRTRSRVKRLRRRDWKRCRRSGSSDVASYSWKRASTWRKRSNVASRTEAVPAASSAIARRARTSR